MPDVTLDHRALFQGGQSLYLVMAADAPRFTIIGASDIYLRATRRELGDLVGKGIFEAFPESEDDPGADSERSVRASIERVLRTREPHRLPIQKYDVPRPLSEGGGYEEKYWSAIHFPVFDASGELLHVAQRVEDITDLIKLNRPPGDRMETEVMLGAREVRASNLELLRANEELDRHRGELQHLNDKLKDLDELKNQFFSNVSHELRTPLTLIIGPVQTLIRSGTLDGPTRNSLHTVLRNARLLLHHVNDLLDLSKLDAGKMGLRYAEVDLGDLVRLLCGHFTSVAVERHIEYVVDVAAVRAQVDTEKVQRLLMNLLSNAFKFVAVHGRVRCSMRIVGDEVCIEVADNGPGIRPEHRQMVFERFRQVEGSASRRHGGTGLGLAIANDFAHLHRGHITIGDAPEGGALFTVRLPQRAPQDAEVSVESSMADASDWIPDLVPVSAAHGSRPASSDPEAASRPLVLVVEDNPELNAFVQSALADEFRTHGAFDGAEGLAKAAALAPDLIVSDVMMPEMTGDRLVRELRMVPHLRRVPVLLLTAKADDDLRVEMLKAGANDYLVKPFSVEELKARVRNQVETAAARSAAERANHAKNTFLSRMSHELRTPLNSILGFSQLLEMDDRLTPEQRESIVLICRGGRHLLELINEVLDVSAIESGSMSLSLAPVIVHEVVKGAADLIRPIATQRGIAVDPPAGVADDLAVSADRQRLTQILINLLSNAVKYNHANGRITLSVHEPVPGRVRLAVTDTGPGIPPSKMAMLFQPFQRLGAEQTEVEGTGLGLAVSRALAEAMGGSMGVSSVAGKGATFWVELPAAAEAPKRSAALSVGTPTTAVSRAAGTILYIEDNAANVQLMRRVLGYRPRVTLIHAPSGEAGLDVLMAGSIDLVLLDLQLAEMSGRDVLARMQESSALAAVPVVVMSAEVAPGLADELMASGARGVLTKPIDIKATLALLDKMMGDEASHSEDEDGDDR